jgi:hypothetical protein
MSRYKTTKSWTDRISPKNWINNTPEIATVRDQKTGRYETAAGRTQAEAFRRAVEKHVSREYEKKK